MPSASNPAYGKELCDQKGYHCINVGKHDSWKSLWPDEKKRNIVMRLNRTNLPLSFRDFVVVPDHLDQIDINDIAPFPDLIEPQKSKLILVDLKLQAFAAYNRFGYLVAWGPITSGQKWCADVGRSCRTVIGTFRFFKKGDADCKSSTYPVGKGGSPMPHCMFFHGGFALHGAELPGIPSTHGCVGVTNKDAAWLSNEFVDIGKRGTIIKIVA